MGVPYCIIKGKARLGRLCHRRTTAAVCLSTVNPCVLTCALSLKKITITERTSRQWRSWLRQSMRTTKIASMKFVVIGAVDRCRNARRPVRRRFKRRRRRKQRRRQRCNYSHVFDVIASCYPALLCLSLEKNLDEMTGHRRDRADARLMPALSVNG